MLETKNLSRTYLPKNGVPVRALDKVNLTLAERGMVFILGKSGSGKSTFLNVMGGLDKYDEGELIIYGKSSKDFSQSAFDSYRNTYIGFVFQEYNIMNEFSVGQNIALALELQGKKATKENVAHILEQVDLKGYEDRKTNELSGGQKQRVAIARALIKDPKIIMADEPTGALDSRTGEQVFQTLKKLSRDKLVLVVSHDRDFAERYADRIIEFSDGKVVSDTTKTEIAATEESEAISVVDGKILQIKGGATLTEKDLDVINSYLKNNETDTFISLDGGLNRELRKVSKITESGAKESFKETEEEDVPKKDYEKDAFKTIKSRLPLKNSLKIAVSSLKAKPIRLFFTIILSAVAFTLFGLMSVFSSYNKNTSYVETFSDLGTKSVFIQRTEKRVYGDSDDDFYMQSKNVQSSKISELNEEFAAKNLSFVGITGIYESLSFEKILGKELLKFGSYYKDRFNGIATVTESQLEDFGYTLTGTLPASENQIAVTDYFYDVCKTSGTFGTDSNTVFQSLIGKELNMFVNGGTEKTFIITAVINTDFNSDQTFDALKTKDGTDNMSQDDVYNLNDRFSKELEYGLANICFVSPSFMEKYEFENTYYGFSRNPGYLQMSTPITSNTGVGGVYPFSSLSRFESECDCLFYYPNGKSSLSGNSVILPLTDLFDSEAFSAKYSAELDKITVPSQYNDANEYFQYLANDGWASGGKQIMRDTFLAAAQNMWQSMSADDKIVDLSYTTWSGTSEVAHHIDVSIDGIYLGDFSGQPYSIADYSSLTYNRNLTFFGETVAANAYGSLDGAFQGIVANLPDGKTELTSFVEYFGEIKDDQGWLFQSYVSFQIELLDSMVTLLLDIFLYAGVAIAIFAAFLMMNFIATSIVYKKREIGILRAVGARGLDVFGIFFNEALIIALINFALSSVFLALCVSGINSAFQAGMPVAITLFAVGATPILLVLGVSLLTALLASFIPSFKISLKRPIDAIQNR